MVVVSSRDARKDFSDVINRAKYSKERTIITNNGKEVAAVVSMDDLNMILRLIEHLENESDIKAAKIGLEDIEKNGSVSWEDAIKELGY